MSMRFSNVLPIAILVAMSAVSAQAQPRPCGMRVNDWCPVAATDPCGRHADVSACKADPACYGIKYTGESVVRCILDARGFGSNCPTVGCTSTPPQK